MDTQIKAGQFVKVGDDLGVIILTTGDYGIPEDHLGVWYGERTEDGKPLFRTVPEEYCVLVSDAEGYH